MQFRACYSWIFATLVLLAAHPALAQVGQTEITKWRHDKNGAVSLTWDDGSLNQFRVAAPIMDSLGLPATFFIVTGQIPGSQYRGKFIGRPVEEIIAETATTPTNADNIFERASAIGFLGLRGTLEYHTRAGGEYDADRLEEAYKIIDEAYARVRAGEFARRDASDGGEAQNGDHVTWEDIRTLAARGHEFASHTITHPRLAVLDEANLKYEIKMSREEILIKLGPKHTFSVEGPYGTEDERAVAYLLEEYPASRNRMPEPFLDELNRWNRRDPRESDKEYVQWQRGPLKATPLSDMKSWIDTIGGDDNIWLVLVFHGVEGIGWEAKPATELREYFKHIAANEDRVWVATFQDVAKYMRERVHAHVRSSRNGDAIHIDLTHSLDASLYDFPLTLKTEVPEEWKAAEVRQGESVQNVDSILNDGAPHVLYQAQPNAGSLTISQLR